MVLPCIGKPVIFIWSADVLGHKDVNTTRKHYAEIEDERRRKAAKKVKLREP